MPLPHEEGHSFAAVGLNDGNIHLFDLAWRIASIGADRWDKEGAVLHRWTESDPYHWNQGGWTAL